ncbi:hypothetical protein EJB05_26983, partial [Eragrostis curvula]
MVGMGKQGVRAQQIRRASILAIGTANPSNVVEQSTFPDFYLRVTGGDHKQDLKDKFRRVREKSCIKKRHLYTDEALLTANPEMASFKGTSLDARQAIVNKKVPELGAAALKEWGRPAEDITHLIVGSTSGGSDLPGADYHLIRLLGLKHSVRRVALYYQGCYVWPRTSPRTTRAGARVLAVCVETGDWTLRPAGLRETLRDAGMVVDDDDRNSMFWAVHPGGRAILDDVDKVFGLKPDKMRASRKVLAEYGNMGSACVWFVLDEMRRWSAAEGRRTTGEGCDWGALFGFGPGLTLDTVLLRSAPI